MFEEKKQYSQAEQLESSVRLIHSISPSKMKKNLIGLVNLAPEIEDSLLENIELPMQINNTDQKQPFLMTQFNRDGDSYRSPFTNQYYPTEQGYINHGKFRDLQQYGNIMFQEYTKLYYGGDTVGNFFVTAGKVQNCFSCGYFAKKVCQSEQNNELFGGNWDSFNIIDVSYNEKQTTYNITTTILLELNAYTVSCGNTTITGFLKKKKQEKKNTPKDFNEHLENIGMLVESNQTHLRRHLESVYTTKTKQVLFMIRYQNSVETQEHKKQLAEELKKIQINRQ